MVDYKCYLPWRGEFGWMIICFVKKFHADKSPNKIICCKPGHECLFPSASKFYYDWQDIPDAQKAGVAEVTDEVEIIQKVKNSFPHEDIEFVPLSDVGWHNKNSYSQNTFIPESKHKLGLKADIVITPRNRVIDSYRNWTQNNWQTVVDGLNQLGLTVGVCGSRETSFDLANVAYRSYEYIDVDSDVELMNNAKLIITQESGLMYLAFMCRRPTFCIDHYHGSDERRNKNIPFKALKDIWSSPEKLINEINNFLKGEPNDSSL